MTTLIDDNTKMSILNKATKILPTGWMTKYALPDEIQGPKAWLDRQRANVRPWITEFFVPTKFSKPSSMKDVSKRVLSNLDHFQSNYIFVSILLFLYCIITSPGILFVIIAVIGGCYAVNQRNKKRQLAIGGRQINVKHQQMIVGLIAIPFLLMVGVGSAFFWVVGASFVVVMLHAIFYQKYEPISSDDQSDKIMLPQVEIPLGDM
ncbi:hypothetical protein SNEBB_000116 [Seison nebaliae]|nr:hypothetical protein SNEBB_000116 [Seison nebaliae]